MPPEDRQWGDEERLPAFPRDKTSKQSDECSVAPGEAGCPGDLAAKHGQLVAQDEDLDLAVALIAGGRQTKDGAQHHIEE